MSRARGDRWQADALVDGKRVRKSFGTEREADAWEAANRPAVAVVSTHVDTLVSLAEELETILWGRGDQALVAMRHIREAATIIGDIPVKSLHTTHVDKLTIAYQRMGLGPATINRRYASLKRLSIKAFKTDRLHKVPEFEHQEEPEGRKRFLTPDEETKLFDALKVVGQRDYDLAVFLVDTGCRLGEAFSLEWYQVDFDLGRVTFDKTKANHTRGVPMTDRVVELLRRSKGNAQPFSDINRWTARDHWNKARDAAGFKDDPNCVPHILRHTCLSRIVQGGHSLVLAQTWAGHKTASMTGRYVNLAPDTLSGVVETLNRGGRA